MGTSGTGWKKKNGIGPLQHVKAIRERRIKGKISNRTNMVDVGAGKDEKGSRFSRNPVPSWKLTSHARRDGQQVRGRLQKMGRKSNTGNFEEELFFAQNQRKVKFFQNSAVIPAKEERKGGRRLSNPRPR